MHRVWRPLLVLSIAVLAFGVSVAGAARSGDLRDDFASFDVHQWYKSSRPFGWGAVDPANVSASGGMLGIKLPGGTLNGGELRSLSLTRYGSYRARIKVANAPSSMSDSTTSAYGNACAHAMPMQPEPVQRSRIRSGKRPNQGANSDVINSAIGDRGISTPGSIR